MFTLLNVKRISPDACRAGILTSRTWRTACKLFWWALLHRYLWGKENSTFRWGSKSNDRTKRRTQLSGVCLLHEHSVLNLPIKQPGFNSQVAIHTFTQPNNRFCWFLRSCRQRRIVSHAKYSHIMKANADKYVNHQSVQRKYKRFLCWRNIHCHVCRVSLCSKKNRLPACRLSVVFLKSFMCMFAYFTFTSTYPMVWLTVGAPL